MKEEIQAFIADAEAKDHELQNLQNVYTTDHVPKQKKYNTLNEEEDSQFFEYLKRVKEYNQSNKTTGRVDQYESGRYPLGSLMQRIAEPLAGAKKLENGARFYEVREKDLVVDLDENTLKAKYEKAKELGEQVDCDDEDQETLRTNAFNEISDDDIDTWNAILDRELAKFGPGEEYSYVKDMRKSYA